MLHYMGIGVMTANTIDAHIAQLWVKIAVVIRGAGGALVKLLLEY